MLSVVLLLGEQYFQDLHVVLGYAHFLVSWWGQICSTHEQATFRGVLRAPTLLSGFTDMHPLSACETNIHSCRAAAWEL